MEEASNRVVGEEQYAMRAFADALEAVPIALAENMGVTVTRAAFVIELPFLAGRAKLKVPVTSLVSYES